MGAWDVGLYSSDVALDLKASLRALARLPFDGARLLKLLRATEPAADDPEDEDHTVFWLVAADQFVRHGIVCAEAHKRALDIIVSGADLSELQAAGRFRRVASGTLLSLDSLKS